MSYSLITVDMSEQKSPPSEDANTEPWTFELFGCLGDWRLCLATFLCPCYTLGRNASYYGEDGTVAAVLYCTGFVGFGPLMRWRIRQDKKIKGSMIHDVVLSMLCPWCSLIQENKELYGLFGSHIGEQVPLNVEMERK